MTMERVRRIVEEMGLSTEEYRQLAGLAVEYTLWMDAIEVTRNKSVRDALLRYVKEDIKER